MTFKIILRGSVAALAILAALQLGLIGGAVMDQPSDGVMWTFDRLENIGGHKTTILGQPKVIDSPVGKAVEFDGVDDAIFLEAAAGNYQLGATSSP